MSRTFLTSILVTALAAVWLPVVAAETDPFGFTEDQYSSWGIVDAPYPYEGYNAEGEYIDYGCFPVGNGLVFGHLGVDEDFNTLRGLTGPGYQTREDDGGWAVWQEGNWPDMRLVMQIGLGLSYVIPLNSDDVNFDESSFPFEQQSIQQLRGAAMVRVKQTYEYGTLYSLTYCLPEKPVLIREFIFEPTGPYVVALSMKMQGLGDQEDRAVLRNGPNMLELLLAEDYFNTASVERDRFYLGFQHWGKNPMIHCAIAVVLTKDGQPAEQWQINEDDLPALRQQTYDHWQNWSAQNLQFDSGAQRLDDMMIQLPVIIETQRDYYSGGCSPMVSYHGYWVRDSNGPILAYLANGRFDEVLRMLRYHRACCFKNGRSDMLVPLDMDLIDVAGWKPDIGVGAGPSPGPRAATGGGPYPVQPTAGDLSGIGTQAADWEDTPVEHAEVPSLIVLQHYWLWKAMCDAGLQEDADAFIAEAWAFISHNLFTMSFHPEYGVYFHGDETYTQGALYSTYDREESGAIGYPNGYIPTQDYTSFDNTILHRAAAAGLAEMGEALGKAGDVSHAENLIEQLDGIVRDEFTGPNGYNYPAIAVFTGQPFNSPFTNINLRPFWLGLDYGSVTTQENLLFQNGKSTPWSDFATGHAAGYVCHALTWFGNTAWDMPEKALLASASPEGAWCEVLKADRISESNFDYEYRPVPIYGRINRIRPWESGVNYNALVEYITKWEPKLSNRYFQSVGESETVNIHEDSDLLIITKSADWKDQVKLDSRLRGIPEERITGWDAGLPFGVVDLRNALLGPVGQAAMPADSGVGAAPGGGPRAGTGPGPYPVKYLCFDRGVRGGLDRRTMKDHDFWYGEEMTKLLAEYEAAGGTVIEPETIQSDLAYDEVVALKLLVVLFPNTFTHSMNAAEIENFHHEMAEWVAWYDTAADMRVKLELDFLQVDTMLNELQCGPQGDNVYWLGHEDVEDMLLARGVPLDHYDNVCAFWAWDRDNTALPGGEAASQAYGGAAQGPATDMEFLGKSKRTGYFGSAVLEDRPDRTSKNAIHEFLHNLDAMLEYSGEERLSHPDQMSRNMDTLLSELPGGFEALGYSDDEMRQWAEEEVRGDRPYAWPAQLVYYKQSIDRVPRDRYALLLTHFGERKLRMPRFRLYDGYTLPDGVAAYQVYYDGTHGFTQQTLEDYDFVNEDDLVWRGLAWPGYLDAPELERVTFYREGEIEFPAYAEFTLGDAPALNPGVMDAVSGTGIPGARLQLVLEDGREFRFSNFGGYEYSLDLPADVQSGFSATLIADKDGYVITPRPVEVALAPPWELTSRYGLDDKNMPQLTIEVGGPFDEYTVKGRLATDYNTVQTMLAEDGLLRRVDQQWEFKVTNNTVAAVSIPPSAFETVETLPLEIAVSAATGNGNLSYTHRIPPTRSMQDLLQVDDASLLPGYIPRCRPLTASIDGELSEWTAEPSIVLTGENGHVFSGTVDSKADASVVLWLGYDDDYLYIAGGVRDDMTPGNGTWDSDRINLCFDAELNSTPDSYPDGAVGHTAWQRDDFWAFLNPLLAEGPQAMRLGGERPSGGKNGYHGPLADCQVEVVEEEGGAYRFEWAIPWKSLPYLSPQPGGFCGFTMFYSDYDESLSELMYVTDWGGSGGIDWRFWDCGLLYFEE